MANVIPDFLQDLEDATTRKGRQQGSTELKVINMRSKANWGKAIIVPIDGANEPEGAIKQLNRVAHVEKWISGTTKEGKEYGFAKKMYFFLDPKYYGDLNDAQMAQFERVKSKFNTVTQNGIQGVGIHQMTLIQGLAVRHTDRSTPNAKVIYEGIPALYIYESKNFEKAFRKTLNDMYDTMGSYNWLIEMCNREPIRKRYFSIDFYLEQSEGAGFQVTTGLGKFDEDVAKLYGNKPDGLDLSIKEEGFLDKFQDPIKYWLEIPQDGPRFNEEYINEFEAILNKLLKGETYTEVRVAKKEEPTVPDSNSNFKEQPETAEIPTEVKSEAPVEKPKQDDYLPF